MSLCGGSLVGCVADDDGPETESPLKDLQSETLATSGRWELAPHQARVATTAPTTHPSSLSREELTAIGEAALDDPTWYAADGERYEALFIAPDGKTFGRLGPAEERRPPTEENDYGASRGVDPGEPEGELVDPGADSANRTIIQVDSSGDRRTRVSSVPTLQSYPYRTIGSFPSNGTSSLLAGGCTGTKIGPRAVLTASHCVMDEAGTVTTSGYFNPGQTNYSWPNSSSPWAGVYLRDWRTALPNPNSFDYAVLFLADNASMVGLGWMGITWFPSASSYNGRWTKMFGYPAGPLHPDGVTSVQTCKASPRLDDRCDGWMYGMSAALVTADFITSPAHLSYDHDISLGTSGAALYETYTSGAAAALGVCSWYWDPPQKAQAVRFRQSMYDDVCSWIADPSFQSAYDEHPDCHP